MNTLTSEVAMTVTELRDGRGQPDVLVTADGAPGEVAASEVAPVGVAPGGVAPSAGTGPARSLLVRILQDAHAGELAAAYAYRAHARSLWRRPVERAEVCRIEAAEWHHRGLVARMLVDLGAGPRRRRELLMAVTGRIFGLLCFVTGWFGPMYAAGRLEATNADQYRLARDLAARLGHHTHACRLEVMRVEEVRHERWFGDRVQGHRLLPIARLVLRWSPPPARPMSSGAGRSRSGMSTRQLRQLRALEGRRVCMALRDGSRLDGCHLISAGRSRVDTVWVFANGEDTFVRIHDVLDLWEDW